MRNKYELCVVKCGWKCSLNKSASGWSEVDYLYEYSDKHLISMELVNFSTS